ncbi:MAG TPA: hypothetical protein PKI93_03565 [Alphaproteobacteria bacterium]|nr:hypothetical protein [Alphaproteobacteria bacterium]HNS44752.1 hypothetical protein [Alphaproteobacteria bacterium]
MMLRSLPLTAYLTATTALLVFMPHGADAAVDAEGAEQLKSAIQGYIDEQKQIASVGGSTLTTEGDLIITPKDKYYEIVTPHIKALYPNNMTYDLGKIAINVMPTDSPEEWKFSYTLPSPISLTGPDSKDVMKVTLGNQKTGGVWNTKLGYTSKLKAAYQNIEFLASAEPDQQPTKGTIKAVSLDQNFSIDPTTQKWSGPIHGMAQNIVIGTETETFATIGEADVDYMISGLDAAAMQSLRNQFKQMGGSGENMANIQNNPQQILKIFDVMGSMFESQMGEASAKFSIKGLAVNTSAKASNGHPVNFSLATGYWGMSFNQSTPPKSGMGFSIGMNGLKTNDAEFVKFIPEQFDLDIKVHDFPMAEIIKIGKDQATAQLGQSQTTDQAAVAPTPPNFPAILAQAGSRVTHALKISAPAYKVNGSGEAKASTTSPMGVVADQNLEIEGLDAVIAELNQHAAADPNMKQAAGPLAMLQMMGQQDKDNPALRTYHLVVDEQGKVTMNGADMSSMMGGAPMATNTGAPQ